MSLFDDPKEMSMTPESPIATGWYLTPDREAERYYDGSHWTSAYRAPQSVVAPSAPDPGPAGWSSRQNEGPTGVVTAGYITAILIPIVGFFIGIVAIASDNPANKKHGGWIMVASVVAFIVWLAIISSAGSGGGDYSSY